MYAEIKGVGKYTPSEILTNDDLSKLVDTSDEWIYKRTGIKERRVSETEDTSDLCINAGKEIIKNSGINKKDIDLVIVATMTGDYQAPSTACIVQNGLGLENAVAFDVNAACAGFILALSVGEKYINSGAYENVLVIGGDVMSKVIDYTDRTTCILFGDGAGGVLLQKSSAKKFLGEKLYSDGEKNAIITSGKMPLGKTLEKDRYLKMEGKEVFNFIVKSIPKNIEEVLNNNGLNKEDVKYYILHQANLRMIQEISRRLKVDIDKFYTNIDRYGNTSSGSVPIALTELVEDRKINKGDKIILSGFGSGITWGTHLIEY